MPEIVYAGSAYPVDWGERDAKTLRVVDIRAITDGRRACQQTWDGAVPYGHPARIKLDVDS